MLQRLHLLFVAGLGIAALGSAQTGPTLVDVGYSNPAVLRVAPGQVITLFASGAKTVLPQGRTMRAASAPLPITLGGFSVAFTQGDLTIAAPMLSVGQSSTCLIPSGQTTTPDCLVTAITVQVPYGILPTAGSQNGIKTAFVSISDGGAVSSQFRVLVLPQNFHILTTCDSTMTDPSIPLFPNGCTGIVTHVDGTVVTRTNPAHVGETVVMYVFGLGPTSPVVPAGQLSPEPAAIALGSYRVSFAYRGPLPTTPVAPTVSAGPATPTFVGLTPGLVGLYQVNFAVASPAPGTVSDCQVPDLINVTITLSLDLSSSTDTVGICVAQ